MEFSRRCGAALLTAGLRHNYLLHLINLWDNALIDTHALSVCMAIVDGTEGAPVPA